jgi:hypothetical protein
MTNSTRKTKSPYSAAFTAGGILYREINAVLPLIMQKNKVELLNKEKLENKYLSINSEASRKRVLQEIIKRVQLVNDDFWQLYINVAPNQQRLMLFFLCLDTYTIIKVFHFDVTLPKWRALSRTVDLFEYKMKLDEIAACNDDVDSWTNNTKQKVLTVNIRMLNEAGFVLHSQLVRPFVSPELASYVIQKEKAWFLEACFLNEPERKAIMENYL